MDRLDQRYLSDLVVRAKLGGSNAFAELFAAAGKMHFAYVSSMLHDRKAAQHALVECMVQIRRGLPGLLQPELYMPWACRICYLHCTGESDGSVGMPEGTYALSQVLQLPLAESQILLMHFGQGMSLAAIGDLMNFGTRLVRRLLLEGKKRLRRFQPAGAGTPVKRCDSEKRSSQWQTLDAVQMASALEEVFKICGLEDNSVPLEALSSYAVYRKERFSLQRGILAAMMLIFFLLPGLFLLPELNLSAEGTGLRGLPVYSLQVRSLLPVHRVTASIQNRSLPVYEEGAKRFSLEPTRNGDLSVTVELANRQSEKITCRISDVDATCPVLLQYDTDEQLVCLKVRDAGIGVNYSGVYAAAAGGKVIRPYACDSELGEIWFDYPNERWDVYIPDYIGNTLHLALTLE